MDSKISFVAIGQQIKKRRNEKNYSREQLAELMGVSPATVKDLERGINTNPTLKTINAICVCLDCSPNYLFGIDEQPTPTHKAIANLTGLSTIAIDRLMSFSRDNLDFVINLYSDLIADRNINASIISLVSPALDRLALAQRDSNGSLINDQDETETEFQAFRLQRIFTDCIFKSLRNTHHKRIHKLNEQ